MAAIALGLTLVGYRVLSPADAEPLPAAIDLPPGAAAGFNVVLFTLDTLRADRLGCYGYQGVETPAIDALAAGGVRFAHAVTPVPMTLPSHASIMTGTYPPTHGVRDNGTYRLTPEQVTLAERLQDQGYSTAAFIAAFVLDRRYGLAQGFDLYDDQITPAQLAEGVSNLNPQRTGDAVTDSAIRWLDEFSQTSPDRPFFAWVHLFDPHAPYAPPEPYKSRYASSPYDGEVAFTDHQVGRFVDRLGEIGLMERTLIVVVGDHGEGLGDHGESAHSLLIYGATIRAPLIFYGPALIPAGVVIDDRVAATIDVMPTLLDLLGLPTEESRGVSHLRAEAQPDRAVYAETLATQLSHGWSPLYGLRRLSDKYIEAPTPEYYDLEADPGELNNLWSARHEEAERLKDRLADLMTSFAGSGDDGAARVAMDQEAIDKLAALGYVGGGGTANTGPLPDPKDMIALFDREMATASALVTAGQHTRSIPLIERLLATNPNDAGLWSLLSSAQLQASRLEDAINSRLRSIELQPGDPGAWIHLARLQFSNGDRQAAEVSLAEADRLEPHSGETSLVRARHAWHDRQYEAAIAHCQEAARRDPMRFEAPAWLLQGQIHEEAGVLPEADAAYRRALQANPSDAPALAGLARLAERQGDPNQAIQFARAIPPGTAEWVAARVTLARAYLQLDQGEQAIQVMAEWVEAAPNDASAYTNLGAAYLQLERFGEAADCFRAALALNPNDATAQRNLAIAEQALNQAE